MDFIKFTRFFHGRLVPLLKQKRSLRWCIYMLFLFLLFLVIVPAPRFDSPYSTVLYSADSILLNARVASDEQWRFEEEKGLPEKYVKALLLYEDKYFYYHPGINPAALVRAAGQDLHAGRIVSGGSTITMQLARLSRGNPPRTFFEKFWETLMALKAECVYSKKEILEKYAAHAPFGSNVVGIQAACWRFFGIEPGHISWAQAATLAVLPNSPALIFPGKNQQLLKKKRNDLLKMLLQHGDMDKVTYSLALEEPVPGPPKALPQEASELLLDFIKNGMGGQTVYATVNAAFQARTERIIENYHQLFIANKIYNAAALIIDIKTGNTLAYVGNTEDTTGLHGSMVDIITADRSYGSILKPVLYMAAMDAGKICPETLLPDFPINFGGFSPKNFNLTYDGVVSADQALVRSLNIPNVILLKRYGTAQFLSTLRDLGLTSFSHSSKYYGLSLILGGGESSLWQLTGMYAALAKRLLPGNDSVFSLSFQASGQNLNHHFYTSSFNPAAIWTAFNVMTQLYRPGDNGRWQRFSSAQKIAWKTGTSFGNRDGWAIGITPKYAVGVWVGNADGEGRPQLTGAEYAAPILFDIFSALPHSEWFNPPKKGWAKAIICEKSGALAGTDCPDTVSEFVPSGCVKSPACTFHQRIHLDSSGKYRVNSSCVNPLNMISKTWFVLRPAEALYYSSKHSDYQPLPPLREDCRMEENTAPMTLIYPSDKAKIYIPKEREGNRGKVIFTVAHRNPKAIIYWHADGGYLGSTKETHQMEIQLPEGIHHFTLVDNEGNMLEFAVDFLQKAK
jgi:penicillin-binding protein 1C